MSREENFRKKQHVKQVNNSKNTQQRENQPGRMPTKRRFTAKKGTAQKAKKRKRKINMKLRALILAGIIGMGSFIMINNHKENRPAPVNIIQIQQEGIDVQSLGLSEETIELFEKYDKYFNEFDEDAQYALREEQVINMINEINEMHFSVVKEKMGSLVGEETKNIKMYYNFDQKNGEEYASVVIQKNGYETEGYTNNYNWIIPDKNTIPSELVDIITQLADLNSLKDDVTTDKITKVNAVKELRKLYTALERVATGEFIKDERGNVSIIHYGDKKVNRQQDGIERDD